MKRLIIDIDGVLAAFNRPFAELLIQHGAALRAFEYDHDPVCWGWPEAYGAGPEHIEAAWEYIRTHPRWWAMLPRHHQFTAKAREQLSDLCDSHEVTFVTARINGRNETARWLANIGNVLEPHVVLCRGNKAALVRELRPDAIIEDNLETLMALRADCECILVDRPYNMSHRSGLRVAFTTGEALEMAANL